MLTLTQKDTIRIPLELAGIGPDSLVGHSLQQIERLSVWYGNQESSLGEIFSIRGNLSDGQLTFVGEFHAAAGIGAGLKSGLIRVDGDAGHDVGLGMWGGEIEVSGTVQDNLGAEMHGGVIRVRGSAGTNVGGALPGSKCGMQGGTILVDGNAGDFLGYRMRRGLIAIRGEAGDFAGHSMLAGSIIAGGCGVHPGVEMSRGTICLAQVSDVSLLPTFRRACIAHIPVLGIIGRELQSLGFENELWNARRQWQQFSGDMLVSGRGEIFTSPC